MLVLSRKVDEQVVLQWGEQTALVRVVEISRRRVRLGITAPSDVAVHRKEIAERIREWQKADEKVGHANGHVGQQRTTE